MPGLGGGEYLRPCVEDAGIAVGIPIIRPGCGVVLEQPEVLAAAITDVWVAARLALHYLPHLVHRFRIWIL